MAATVPTCSGASPPRPPLYTHTSRKGVNAMSNVIRTRCNTLYIRLDDEEYQQFEKQRLKSCLNKTDFFLLLLKQGTIKIYPIKQEVRDLIFELKKQGNNLNQIAYRINQNPFADVQNELARLQTNNNYLTDRILSVLNRVTLL